MFLPQRIILLYCFACIVAPAAPAQIPGLTSAQPVAAVQQNVAPPDPLGRDNPRGTVLGFIKASQEEKYSVAIQYFQPQIGRRHSTTVEETELAEQLLAILNQKLAGPLDFLSRDPQGRLDDGLPPDQERVSNGLGVTDKFPVLLVRIEDEQGHKLWYVSRATLDQVPEMYEALTFPELEKKVPKFLVVHRFLSMPFWQWIAIILFVPIVWFLARILVQLLELVARRWRKSHSLPPLPHHAFFRLDPVTLAIGVLLHYLFVSSIGTSLLYRIYYRRLIWIFVVVAFYWILTRISRAVASRVGTKLAARGMLAERSIVSLIRRFVEIITFLFVALIVLHTLGMNVSTALAGVGIGGLALGLGAQKTFENMFGGISILFDKVIQVGDPCRINNQTGIVEDIGLRSTRLRTAERTLLSIPNGILASATLENLRFRDKFLCQQVVRLRYDLSPDHLRYVLGEIRRLLDENPKTEDSTARVRLLRFAEYALEIEIYCYFLEHNFEAYLAAQEAMLLQVMDTLEKSGAVMALPTQTTMVSKDSWIDPEKTKAVQAAIDKVRSPGVPGPDKPPPSS